MALFHAIREGIAKSGEGRRNARPQQHLREEPSSLQPMLPLPSSATAVPQTLFEWMAFAQRHNAWRLKELLLASPELAESLQTGARGLAL
jgi:hypothetical protein